MFETVDWSHAEGHLRERGRITVAEANDALADPERVVIDPDYNSKSGRSVRIIGFSPLAGWLLTIIVVEEDGREYGVNGWHSNDKDHRIYNGEEI